MINGKGSSDAASKRMTDLYKHQHKHTHTHTHIHKNTYVLVTYLAYSKIRSTIPNLKTILHVRLHVGFIKIKDTFTR